MSAPTVSMLPPAGTSPTQIVFRDGSTLNPNGVFPAQIPAAFVVDLLAQGWTLFVAGVTTGAGTGHIP